MPVTPQSLNNLIPAKKGEVRNPKGKAKGTLNMSTIIRDVFSEEITDANGNPTIKAVLATKAIFDKATSGDVSAYKELVDRIEGKPFQKIYTENDHRVSLFTEAEKKAEDVKKRDEGTYQE
jgi:hypothetical protein